ncbi:hypothetical protein BDV27DRAFT_153678 [Aspergillus caelatus]|uniref:Uncharacterized protein n=1 Tax=Aspergillus caelatus TaxID=61420 RepID=A0A5N7AG61_9EURO|nr:uncharacterized protein BDV27DRAFT_153678 [Aspergillus caelatus]KAE8368854.1 hypothetical protein BDV27DRAFT_153678 [Aspergillus caelatus]
MNANGDIYNPAIINRPSQESRRRRRRNGLVNGTRDQTTGDSSSFVVTHYDDDDDDDSHGTGQSVDEPLAASGDETITPEQQRAEQGPQEQGSHHPVQQHQQLGQQQSGQQEPESQGHEMQQLGPQQQSSELPPREPMPRERVIPQQDPGEPASILAPMAGRGQPGRNRVTFSFGPNGIQPRGYTSRRPTGSNPASPANQQAQSTQGNPDMPGTFPVGSEDEGREH